MRKKLCMVGNSLALVIDKPIRRLMMLGPSNLVEVRTDGRRLIVQGIPETPIETVDQRNAVAPGESDTLPMQLVLDAPRIAFELFEHYGMNYARLARLHPNPPARVFSFVSWCRDERSLSDANAEERAIIRRIQICHEQLVRGRTFDEAIAVALYAVPMFVITDDSAPATPAIHA